MYIGYAIFMYEYLPNVYKQEMLRHESKAQERERERERERGKQNENACIRKVCIVMSLTKAIRVAMDRASRNSLKLSGKGGKPQILKAYV
jgi:hypothetical protein